MCPDFTSLMYGADSKNLSPKFFDKVKIKLTSKSKKFSNGSELYPYHIEFEYIEVKICKSIDSTRKTISDLKTVVEKISNTYEKNWKILTLTVDDMKTRITPYHKFIQAKFDQKFTVNRRELLTLFTRKGNLSRNYIVLGSDPNACEDMCRMNFKEATFINFPIKANVSKNAKNYDSSLYQLGKDPLVLYLLEGKNVKNRHRYLDNGLSWDSSSGESSHPSSALTLDSDSSASSF